MKKQIIATACALALTLASAPLAHADGTAVDAFIGKKIVAESGTVFEYRADGTIGGLLGGKAEIQGKYLADADMTCNADTAPEPLVGKVHCSRPRVEGDTVTFVRADGSETAPYTIQ